jgi:hypothetical protein
MVGIAFPKERPRTGEEKREMEAIGPRFFKDAQAWLKDAIGFAHRRRLAH